MAKPPRSSSTRPIVSTTVSLAVALLVVMPVSRALAQDQQDQRTPANRMQQDSRSDNHAPPPILVIYREDVKAGRTAPHEKLEASWARVYAKMPEAAHYLAMTSISGPPEAWFIEGHGSMVEIEKELAATDRAPAAIKTELEQLSGRETDNLESMRTITALYREDLSYNSHIDMPRMRFMEVTTYRVRPGHNAEFMEAAKMVRAAYEKANLSSGRWAVYEVYSGAPGGTFYVFNPVESLSTVDPNPGMQKAYREALGDEGGQKLMKTVSDSITSFERSLFAFNPKMSYAPPQFAEADAFWAPKGPVMARAGGPTGKQVGTTGKVSAPAKVKEVKKDDRPQ